MNRFLLLFCLQLIATIAISQEKVYSDTLYYDENKQLVKKGEHFVEIMIDSVPLLLYDGVQVYPFLAKKKPYKSYVEGYSLSTDSINPAYFSRYYNNKGQIDQLLLQNYQKYITHFPELQAYYKLLEPYINPVFCAVDSNFTLEVQFRRNNKLEYIAVYDADCGCIGTAYVRNRFNPHIFYIRDKNGIHRNGRDFTYEMNGRIVKEEFYKDDKRHGARKDYDSEGRLKNLETYSEDKRNGKFIRYYKGGSTREVTHYKMGKRHGAYKKYYQNGNLEEEGQYFEGNRMGEWFYYNSKEILNTFRIFIAEESDEKDK